jgi:hypothetical protein
VRTRSRDRVSVNCAPILGYASLCEPKAKVHVRQPPSFRSKFAFRFVENQLEPDLNRTSAALYATTRL